MATNKELEKQLNELQVKFSTLHATNMRLSDEVLELKSHYGRLVKQLNQRLEIVDKQFRKA